MTDKEKFQKTFDKLHASPDVLTEVLNMTTEKKSVPIRRKRYAPKVAVGINCWIWKCGICNGSWWNSKNSSGMDPWRSD